LEVEEGATREKGEGAAVGSLRSEVVGTDSEGAAVPSFPSEVGVALEVEEGATREKGEGAAVGSLPSEFVGACVGALVALTRMPRLGRPLLLSEVGSRVGSCVGNASAASGTFVGAAELVKDGVGAAETVDGEIGPSTSPWSVLIMNLPLHRCLCRQQPCQRV